MTMNKLFALALFLGFSLTAKAQQNCKANEYAAVVYYAQGLDPLTEGLGRKMLSCANRDYRESSLYWLSFYYSMTNQRAKIPELSRLLPREVLSNPNLIAQSAALHGNPSVLQERVNAGAVGYVDDPWLVITLARSQMIAEQYKAAFASYQRVLKLRENQDSTEIELLYSYIWAKDREAALAKIAQLRRYEPEPYMQQSLNRAEALLKTTDDTPEIQHDFLSLAYIQERDNRGYGAKGGRVDYHGIFNAEIEGLEHEHPLEEKKEKVASISVGKHWGSEEGFQVATDIGYYSAGDDNITGLLGAHYHFHHVEAGLTLRRKEVSAFERTPPGEHAGLMRDSFLWNFGLYDRFFVNGALHSEDEVLFEDYGAELRLGALLKEETDSGFGLIVPISYRHRPIPSADYRTYPHDFRIGLGVRLGYSDGKRFLMRTEAVLESVNRDDYGAVDSYEALLGARIKAHLRYYFQKSYYNFFEGSAYSIEAMPGETSDDKGSEFLFGFGITQESH